VSKNALLQDRAEKLREARQFFFQRGIVEVDTPLLGKAAPIDVHIDVMCLSLQGGGKGYLHTSPEYAMKRLLAAGMGDIYQLSHVFREAEVGPLHNPEFTMVEWYRLGFTFQQMMEETEAFIHLFLKDLPIQRLSYKEAFLRYAGIDYATASCQELIACAAAQGLALSVDIQNSDKNTLLQAMMSFIIEPHLGKGGLTTLFYFPAAQSALAKTGVVDKELIAYRFEIYFQGIELANGYHELADAKEQRQRLEHANKQRQQLGKESLPLDEQFLLALEQGLPDCCGVAVGFDRLMLLRHKKKTLADVLPFCWE
jgi:lysyl-tRNA synthetase class 2